MQRNQIFCSVTKRVRSLVGTILRSGLTPQKLALTLCLGTALGVMPLLCGSTLLCALLAARFKLNQATMQAVNYCCYPLQLALLLPFCRLGEILFPWGPAVSGEVLLGGVARRYPYFASTAGLGNGKGSGGLADYGAAAAPTGLSVAEEFAVQEEGGGWGCGYVDRKRRGGRTQGSPLPVGRVWADFLPGRAKSDSLSGDL